MARVYTPAFSVPLAAASSAGSSARARHATAREQDWKGYAQDACSSSASSSRRSSTRSSACRATCSSTPTTCKGVPSHIALNTTASFVTNTNWQYYGGEYTMSYLTQMAGLAVQNFVSAGVGMAVLVAVIRGIARRSAARARELLGRPLPLARLRAAAAVVVLALILLSQGVAADLRRSRDRDTRWRAPRRRSRAARPRRRSRSSSSARTAAASTTRTRPCRSRTRTGSRTSSRCSRSC